MSESDDQWHRPAKSDRDIPITVTIIVVSMAIYWIVRIFSGS